MKALQKFFSNVTKCNKEKAIFQKITDEFFTVKDSKNIVTLQNT